MGTVSKLLGVDIASVTGLNGKAIADVATILGQTVDTESYLLDDYGDDIEGAYSMRILKADYTGYCMKVRNENSGVETEIGFVDAYVNTAAIEAAADDGGTDYNVRLIKWYDQSGNGRDFSRAYDASCPLVFDGSALITLSTGKQALEAENNGWLPTNAGAAFSIDGAGTSIFNLQEWATNWQSWIYATGGTGTVWADAGYGYVRGNAGTLVQITSGRPAEAASGIILGQVIFNGASSAVYENGSGGLISGDMGSNDADSLFLLRGMKNGHRASEILIYSAEKSSDRVGIRDNINDYWEMY